MLAISLIVTKTLMRTLTLTKITLLPIHLSNTGNNKVCCLKSSYVLDEDDNDKVTLFKQANIISYKAGFYNGRIKH